MLHSSSFWYSALSGASWARPGRLVWSQRVSRPAGRRHCPSPQSGYLDSSCAKAFMRGIVSAAMSTKAPMECLLNGIRLSHADAFETAFRYNNDRNNESAHAKRLAPTNALRAREFADLKRS